VGKVFRLKFIIILVERRYTMQADLRHRIYSKNKMKNSNTYFNTHAFHFPELPLLNESERSNLLSDASHREIYQKSSRQLSK